MAKAGDVIENPITGERIIFLKTTRETNGELLRYEYVLPPGFTIPEHIHPQQEERHEVLSGTLRGRVGGQERDYGEGERMIGPAGVPHAWQNPSPHQEARIVSEIRPPLAFEALFETYCGLAWDGKMTKQGIIPRNPLLLQLGGADAGPSSRRTAARPRLRPLTIAGTPEPLTAYLCVCGATTTAS